MTSRAKAPGLIRLIPPPPVSLPINVGPTRLFFFSRRCDKDFDISLERVRQIYLKLKEQKDNFDPSPVFKKRLSKRIKRALTEYYGSEDILENPQIIDDMSVGKIWQIKKIGRKALHEISNALNEFGYTGWRY